MITGATDLSQIYPTPPSHDNHHHHTALSPLDNNPLHNLHISTHPDPSNPQHETDASDITSDSHPTSTAIYRTTNLARYVTVTDYQPIELPSCLQSVNVPTACKYEPHNAAANRSQ